MIPSKPRVEYIDLVKGFCMLFVLSFHCHVTYCPTFYSMIRCMYLPAFFFCAALFFKPEQPFCDFFVRKVNLLLVPWAFFIFVSLICYAAVYLFGLAVPASGIHLKSVIGDNTLYEFIKFPADLPAWYLWCIFFSFMVYYAVARIGRGRVIVRLLLVIALAVFGTWMESYSIRKPLMTDSKLLLLYDFHFFTALTMLPFMFAGEELRKLGLLKMNFRSLRGLLIFAVSMVVWIVFSQKTKVTLYGHVWQYNSYLPAFAGTFAVLAFMAAVRRFPVIHFLGRYSLTVLCTHYMILLGVEYFVSNYWLQLVCVLPATLVVVWFFVKYFPTFTGQRNLIPLPGSK